MPRKSRSNSARPPKKARSRPSYWSASVSGCTSRRADRHVIEQGLARGVVVRARVIQRHLALVAEEDVQAPPVDALGESGEASSVWAACGVEPPDRHTAGRSPASATASTNASAACRATATGSGRTVTSRGRPSARPAPPRTRHRRPARRAPGRAGSRHRASAARPGARGRRCRTPGRPAHGRGARSRTPTGRSASRPVRRAAARDARVRPCGRAGSRASRPEAGPR